MPTPPSTDRDAAEGRPPRPRAVPRTIDCRYLDEPEVAAAYLLRDGEHAAFVDNNTARAVPLLLAALAAEGLAPEAVDYLVVTHVHLDHAGGTAALAAACPRARVLCHPRAARHLIDPTKLVQGARAVYGDATFDRLYPDIGPIDERRVRTLADGESVPFGRRTLTALHTRGHANHHLCLLDDGGAIFTGDSFGLAYPRLQRAGLFVFPSTSPTDFDGPEARRSIARIVSSGADAAYLSHFGAVQDLAAAAAQLEAHLDDAERVLARAIASPVSDDEVHKLVDRELRAAFDARLAARGLVPTEADRAFLALDLDLNAQGIAHVATKARAEARAGGAPRA